MAWLEGILIFLIFLSIYIALSISPKFWKKYYDKKISEMKDNIEEKESIPIFVGKEGSGKSSQQKKPKKNSFAIKIAKKIIAENNLTKEDLFND